MSQKNIIDNVKTDIEDLINPEYGLSFRNIAGKKITMSLLPSEGIPDDDVRDSCIAEITGILGDCFSAAPEIDISDTGIVKIACLTAAAKKQTPAPANDSKGLKETGGDPSAEDFDLDEPARMTGGARKESAGQIELDRVNDLKLNAKVRSDVRPNPHIDDAPKAPLELGIPEQRSDDELKAEAQKVIDAVGGTQRPFIDSPTAKPVRAIKADAEAQEFTETGKVTPTPVGCATPRHGVEPFDPKSTYIPNDPDVDHDKAANFSRIGTARVNKAVHMIELLGNLSNTSSYHYTDDQVDKLLAGLYGAVDYVRDKFKEKDRKKNMIEL